MLRKKWWGAPVVAAVLAGLIPALASPPVVGSLAGSTNATLDGQAPLPNTTVLSGDKLQVRDGLAMVTLDQGNRMVLGRGSDASFSRDDSGVTVALTRGNASLYHPAAGTAVHLKVGDVTVAPAQGFKTLGEVAMVNGLLLVTAKDGTLQVEKAGTTQEVSAGKTITVATQAARAPAPVPSGNSHIKTIWGTNELILVGAIAAGVTATAIVLSNHSTTQSSTFTPGP